MVELLLTELVVVVLVLDIQIPVMEPLELVSQVELEAVEQQIVQV